jgi:flagellar FliL protein
MSDQAATETAALEEVKPKRKFDLKLIIIVVLVLALGSGGALFFLNRGASATKKKTSTKPKAADETAGADEEEETTTSQVSSVIVLEPFIVNLADKDEPRYIRINISLGLVTDNKDEGKEVLKDAVIVSQLRDSIVSVLSLKTAAELNSLEGKKSLRQELLKTIRKKVKKPRISEVYITDIIIQM